MGAIAEVIARNQELCIGHLTMKEYTKAYQGYLPRPVLKGPSQVFQGSLKGLGRLPESIKRQRHFDCQRRFGQDHKQPPVLRR